MSMLKTAALTVGQSTLVWGSRTYVMGILNITPDSFSGDGLLVAADLPSAGDRPDFVQVALEQARRFVEAGADLLDVGGESTRPGSQTVPLEQELERVLPVVRALADELDVLISIDTYKAQVAEAALKAGAQLVNDVWGLRADPDLAGVAARFQRPGYLDAQPQLVGACRG